MSDASAPMVRSEAEAAVVLTEFEVRHRLFEAMVRGVSVWRLIRSSVGLALQNLPFEREPLPRAELFTAFLRSLRDLTRLPKNARYAVRTYVSALRIRGELGYEDIYFERLLESMPGGIRLYSLNAPGYSGRPVSRAMAAVDCTAVLIVGSLLARLFPVKQDAEIFSQLGALISEDLRVNGFPDGRIRRMFSSFWWQSRLYEWILRRIGVKTMFVADTGERALLNACRRQGIRFVELQHGIFTPDHPDSLPFSVLKDVEESALLLPDTLALYGEYWLSRHEDGALGRTGRLLPVGASVIEKFRDVRAATYSASAGCPELVVTTQGVDREALIEFFVQFLGLCTASFLLTVKLHPAYDSSVFPYAKTIGTDPRVRIIAGHDDPNTYELVARADLHLSITSACHYDAIGIGTPTVIIGLAGYQLVQDLLDAGDALFINEPAGLAEIVSQRAWVPVPDRVSSKYYRHGFVSNLLPLIV